MLLILRRHGNGVRFDFDISRGKRIANSPLDTHDEVNLGLSGDVEVSVSLGLPLQADLLSLLLLVVVDVLLGALEDDSALGLASLYITNEDEP